MKLIYELYKIYLFTDYLLIWVYAYLYEYARNTQYTNCS